MRAGNTTWTDRALQALRLERDPVHRSPAPGRVALATLASLGGSLAVDALLVAAGTRLFPATAGYAHFRFSDYGKLTAIGVVVACVAWPITTRISAAPRWLFLRMAVLVTVVLWLPDLWILSRGQPPRAVAVLMVMHLAIALVTYNLLVRLAPARVGLSQPAPAGDACGPGDGHASGSPPELGSARRTARRVGLCMASLVVVELALGIAALVVVPYARRTVLVPAQGRPLYLTHAAVGGLLGVGAIALFVVARRAGRFVRLGSVVGLVGVAMAAGGGGASIGHPTRLLGVGLMLVGSVVAVFGYLMMLVETPPSGPRAGSLRSHGLVVVPTETEQEQSQ